MMRNFCLCSLACSLVVSLEDARPAPPPAQRDFDAPQFTVDLDASPSERWAHVFDALLEARGYENTWKPLHDFLETALPRSTWHLTAPLWSLVLASFPADQRKEVLALHAWFGSKGFDWTLGQCVMVQLFYEVEDGCTSIVAQHKNGSIFHGRNLDYGLPGLQNFTATVTFSASGKPLYRGAMYVGYFGILTGQRLQPDGRGAWSISLNERFEETPYIRTVVALLAGTQNVGFTLRQALANKASYKDAVKTMQNKRFSAPAYLAIAGTAADEGVIITRDRLRVAKAPNGAGFLPLNSANGSWYRLETNYDNWEPSPEQRRQAATTAMNTLGQASADARGLTAVLETQPVLNDETIYTTVMLNEVGYFRTTVRVENIQNADALRSAMVAKVSAGLRNLTQWYTQQPLSTDAESVVV